MPEQFNRIKRLRRMLRNRTGKAILDFQMIQPGDRVLIGVSGGSDSLALLQMFHEGFPHVTHDFTFIAAHIDLGFPGEPQDIESHFKRLQVDYHIIKTDIAQQALSPDAKKNPCFICSMYRRRQIYKIAHREKCKKIAYAHHKDDIIETLLINILYGRKIETMNPVQEVFNGNMMVIRPFTYMEESFLKQYAREMELPVFPKLCPVDGYTRRQKVKELIQTLQREEMNANIKENIFKSLYHVNIELYSKNK